MTITPVTLYRPLDSCKSVLGVNYELGIFQNIERVENCLILVVRIFFVGFLEMNLVLNFGLWLFTTCARKREKEFT